MGLAMFLIRLGTFSRFGHVAFVLSVDPDGSPWVIEAMPGKDGARIRRLDLAVERWTFVSPAGVTEDQAARAIASARTFVNLPYDWRAIARFPLRAFGLHVRGTVDARERARVMCSELWLTAWCDGGVDFTPGDDPADKSPGDVAEVLLADQ